MDIGVDIDPLLLPSTTQMLHPQVAVAHLHGLTAGVDFKANGEACAESKVKCNLHHPCSKCISRGRECVFINDPETSRMKKQLSSSAKRKLSLISSSSSSGATSPSSASPVSAGPSMSPSASLSSLFSDNSSVSSSLNGSQSSAAADLESEFNSSLFFASSSSLSPVQSSVSSSSVPPLSVSPGSSSSSLSTSPPSEFLDHNGFKGSTLDVPFDTYVSYGLSDSAVAEIGPYFEEYPYESVPSIDSEAGFAQYFGASASEPNVVLQAGDCGPVDSITGQFDGLSWLGMDDRTYYTTGLDATNLTATNTMNVIGNFHDIAVEDANIELGLAALVGNNNSIGIAAPTPTSPRTSRTHLNLADTTFYDTCLFNSSSSAASMPASFLSSIPEDLDGYQAGPLSGSKFSIPPILIRAMQACGALFVQTPESTAFVDETIASTRDAVFMEFANLLAKSERETEDLLLTVVLLQTIALFHEKSEQRVKGNVYHGMLVMMIRRIGLIQRVNAWIPTDVVSDNALLDGAWRAWARYETIKRVLFLTYLHDTCHPIYFSLPSSFHPLEMDLCLPCDEALWGAKDARAWYNAAYGGLSSLPIYGVDHDAEAIYGVEYGVGATRLRGFPMQRALTMLQEIRINEMSLRLNPFACFVMIHCILRGVYAEQADDASSSTIPFTTTNGDAHHTNVYALHNWLQTWLASPESLSAERGSHLNPFVHDALPFYWLAQLALHGDTVLVAKDGDLRGGNAGKNVTANDMSSADEKTEGRFWDVKRWLDRIRNELRADPAAGDGTAARKSLWDELMRVRKATGVGSRRREDAHRKDHPDGLLAFF
ncbi:hypothetical protein H0H92_004990 [Tricholoma furcatifolium]|nr:hypothetical protein H0H92_004990 [Tricholoma furcatifolium]